MALPKISDIPYYDVVIPSTGKSAKYRPFLVREEKVLLMAVESQDQKQILNATVELIKACVDTDMNINVMTIYDIEYLFTQIRSKAVGETVDVVLECQNKECLAANDVNVRLDQIKVEVQDDTIRTIDISSKVSVEMRHLPYSALGVSDQLTNPESYADLIFHTVVSCITAVLTEEERLLAEDETRADLEEFVGSLTTHQFTKLREFVENAPTVSKLVEFDCEKCQHSNKYILNGLQDFFG